MLDSLEVVLAAVPTDHPFLISMGYPKKISPPTARGDRCGGATYLLTGAFQHYLGSLLWEENRGVLIL